MAAAELADMSCLDDVSTWAGIVGDGCRPLTLADSFEWKSVAKFASLDPDEYKEVLWTWRYADMEAQDDIDGVPPRGHVPLFDITPLAYHTGL